MCRHLHRLLLPEAGDDLVGGNRGAEGRERVATVEVNPASREVVQAKTRGNEAPDEPCLAILRVWADQEGLKFES